MAFQMGWDGRVFERNPRTETSLSSTASWLRLAGGPVPASEADRKSSMMPRLPCRATHNIYYRRPIISYYAHTCRQASATCTTFSICSRHSDVLLPSWYGWADGSKVKGPWVAKESLFWRRKVTGAPLSPAGALGGGSWTAGR